MLIILSFCFFSHIRRYAWAMSRVFGHILAKQIKLSSVKRQTIERQLRAFPQNGYENNNSLFNICKDNTADASLSSMCRIYGRLLVLPHTYL